MPACGRPVARHRGRRGRRGRARRTASRCTATARGSGTRPSRSTYCAERARRRADTVMFCLSKGLARAGGLVALRTARRRSPRRAATAPASAAACARPGVIAAAGIVALETMVERLADDHARARTLADVLARAVPRVRRPRHWSRPTSCAPRGEPCPPELLAALAARGRARRHHRRRHRALRDPQGRRRRRASRRADRRCSTGSRVAADAGRTRPLHSRSWSRPTTVPPARSPSTRTPTTPRSRPGGTLATWAGGRHAGLGAHHHARRQGHPGPRRRPRRARRAARRGDGQGGGAPRLRRHSTSATPTASSPTTRSCAARSCGTSASCGRRSCCAPIRPRCSSVTATTTTTTTASPAGRPSTRSRPPAGNPHYFPEHLAEGLAVHQVRAVYLSGTLEPNCWIDIARRPRAQDRRACSATPASSPTTGDWFREFLRERAEDGRRRRRRPLRRAVPQAHLRPPDPPLRSRTGARGRGRAGSGGATRPWPAARARRRCRRPRRRSSSRAACRRGATMSDCELDVGDAVADDAAEDPGEHHAAEGEQERPRDGSIGGASASSRFVVIRVQERRPSADGIAMQELATTWPVGSPAMRVLVMLPTYNEIENIQDVLERSRVRAARRRHPGDRRRQSRRHRRPGGEARRELGWHRRAATRVRSPVSAPRTAPGSASGLARRLRRDDRDGRRPVARPRGAPRRWSPRWSTAPTSRSDPGTFPAVPIPDWKWLRRAISRGGGLYARTMLGLSVHDATAGFRAYHRRNLSQIDLDRVRADGYGFQVEMTYLTERNGGRIVEVPIEFRDRSLGRSKMSSRIVVEALLLVTWWGAPRPACRLRRSYEDLRATLRAWPLAEFTVAGALVESARGPAAGAQPATRRAHRLEHPGRRDRRHRRVAARGPGSPRGRGGDRPARHRVGGPALRGARHRGRDGVVDAVRGAPRARLRG